MAGLGAAINTGNVGRGDTVAVIGCGGVGAAAVAGLRAGRRRHDHRRRHRRPEARAAPRSSAPPTRSTARTTDAVEAIQALTGGFGADVVIDAVGRPETWKQAFYARDLAGTVVLVGVPTPDMRILDMPLLDFFGRGGCAEVQLVRRLPAHAATSRCSSTSTSRAGSTWTPSCPRRSALDDVEAAFDKMHHGDVLRSVVVLD